MQMFCWCAMWQDVNKFRTRQIYAGSCKRMSECVETTRKILVKEVCPRVRTKAFSKANHLRYCWPSHCCHFFTFRFTTSTWSVVYYFYPFVVISSYFFLTAYKYEVLKYLWISLSRLSLLPHFKILYLTFTYPSANSWDCSSICWQSLELKAAAWIDQILR